MPITRPTKWILRADEPFRGHAQSWINPNGTVAFSEGLTFDDYAAASDFPVRVVTDAELDELLAAHYEGLRTAPEPITGDVWEDALNCLPPARWRTVRGVNMFHMIELITGQLAHWYAKVGDQHFTMVDYVHADMESLARAVTVRRLAMAFAAILRESSAELEAEAPDQDGTIMTRINEDNAKPGNEDTCASHDFFDANMGMLCAYQNIFGHDPEFLTAPDHEESRVMWNDAWQLAKTSQFWVAPDQRA